MNRLSLIRWPGSGSASGGTSVTADSGTSIQAGVIVLGQLLNQAGNPGKLLQATEIPINSQPLLFTGIGAVAGSHVIFKYNGSAPGNGEPYLEFQRSDGSTVSEIRFGNSINGDGISIGVNNGVPGNRGIYAIGDNILTTNPGTLRDSILIGANILTVAPALAQEKLIVIGDDSLDTGGTVGSYVIIIGHDVCDALGTDPIAASQILIGNFINNSSYPGGGGMGTGNIAIGQSIGLGGLLTNTTIIGNNFVTTISNVVLLGVPTQNVIVGAPITSQTDNGAKLQVLGNITTADPGSGVGKWMLGQHHSAAVTFNTGGYLEVNVDGVVYKVALTN